MTTTVPPTALGLPLDTGEFFSATELNMPSSLLKGPPDDVDWSPRSKGNKAIEMLEGLGCRFVDGKWVQASSAVAWQWRLIDGKGGWTDCSEHVAAYFDTQIDCETRKLYLHPTTDTSASQPETFDDFAAQRLRAICTRLGLADTVPADNSALMGALFTVLGMVRRAVDERFAAGPASTPDAPGPLGYKGRPLRDNATPDQRAAYVEIVRAAQPMEKVYMTGDWEIAKELHETSKKHEALFLRQLKVVFDKSVQGMVMGMFRNSLKRTLEGKEE